MRFLKHPFFCISLALSTLVTATPGMALGAESSTAILMPKSGTYSRPISTDKVEAQQFFAQGLRFAWGFYFPESIASYQEASRLAPDPPIPLW